MPTEPTYTVTRSQLTDALARWEREAAQQGFPARTDGDRHQDAADYLLHMMTGEEVG